LIYIGIIMATTRKRLPKTVSLTIQKTVQKPKFEPSVVIWTETHTMEEDDDYDKVRRQVYQQCSDTVKLLIKKEVERYAGYSQEEE
jgi:hypothetical protein